MPIIYFGQKLKRKKIDNEQQQKLQAHEAARSCVQPTNTFPISENKTLEWVEEIRGRMSQKLQGYNQKLIAFGSSMSETLEELTNTLGKYFIYNTC